jgi:hypothetical protein
MYRKMAEEEDNKRFEDYEKHAERIVVFVGRSSSFSF